MTADLLAQLQAQVGQEVHVGPWLEVTQERVDLFARATEDRQWIHTDPERARGTPFGGTIAHGYLTLSLLPFLMESVREGRSEFPGARMALNYGLNKVRFPHPVQVGSRVRARTELVSARETEGGVEVVRKVTVDIEGASKPGCVAETIVRIYF